MRGAGLGGNDLLRRRRERGLGQAELARAVGLSRQALSALEAGRSIPSTLIALRLARALGCTVEQIFWLDAEGGLIEADLSAGGTAPSGRARLAYVSGRWVAHAVGDVGELADAEIVEVSEGRATARLLEDAQLLMERVVVAGCDPALGLLTRAADRARVPLAWVAETSTRALAAVAAREVHLAGTHLYDLTSGEHNLPFVRRLLPDRACVALELASTEGGLLVAAGNPLDIGGVIDLERPSLRIVNRPLGSAARDLLDRELALAGLAPTTLSGYLRCAQGHEGVARAILEGSADAGVATRAVAIAHGLAFVALHRERFDLVIPAELIDRPPVVRVLSIVNSLAFRRQLAAVGGYDTTGTGAIVGRT